MPKYAAYSIV